MFVRGTVACRISGRTYARICCAASTARRTSCRRPSGWTSPNSVDQEWRYDRKANPRQILVGYARDEQNKPVPVGIDDNRHIMTVAGSRAGKGRWLLVPNLLLYPGSALVLDPKGELAAITARRRQEMGQKVFIIDPFGESGAHKRDRSGADAGVVQSAGCARRHEGALHRRCGNDRRRHDPGAAEG